jgi:acetoin utilization protein AcuC
LADRVALVWYGDDVPLYDLGPQHPLRFERVWLTRRLIHELGILDGERVCELPGRDATDEELRLVHTERYLDVVKRAGRMQKGPWYQFGFGPGDNPVFPGMHEASARVVGATLAATEAVWSGRAEHAFNPAGGLHHAMPERASGFCVYDDPAIAIKWLLGNGADKIAYVDVDAHHGDGPQEIFWDEPRVLTVSLHQSGDTLFPGTGFVDEIGGGKARGTKVNVPLPPYTGDAGWLHAFSEIALPLVEAWKPDVLVTQLGCDTHYTDPLANLMLTTNGFRRTATLLHELAHHAGDKWVAVGGGGYQWATVVPRAWTIYFAEMAEVNVPDDVPMAWLEQAERMAKTRLPKRLSDPEIEESAVDPLVIEGLIKGIKDLVFPRHGLAP